MSFQLVILSKMKKNIVCELKLDNIALLLTSDRKVTHWRSAVLINFSDTVKVLCYIFYKVVSIKKAVILKVICALYGDYGGI